MCVLVIAAGLTVGCSRPDPSERPENAQLSEGGIVSCPDPSGRDTQPFDLQTTPLQPMLEANLAGGGLLVEDLDADGYLDLFLPSVDTAQLYFGDAGSFESAPAVLEGLPLTDAVGATAVDYDADGDLDVFVTRWLQTNSLLRNNGNRTFVDVSERAFGPAAPALRSQSASWADIDADGDLDLFVGSYGAFAHIDVFEPSADCSDHLPDPAELWRNDGDGRFTDVSASLPAEVHDGYSFMSAWVDLQGDGFPELFSGHDDGVCAQSVVVDNVGGVLSVDPGSSFHPDSHDMGMGVADVNGDELPDFLLTSWSGVSYLQSTTGPGGEVAWIDYADSVGLRLDVPSEPTETLPTAGQQVFGWGVELGDVDNDADLDAVMGFGFWSFFNGPTDPFRQTDGLWVNEAGMFQDQGAEWGVDHPGVTRGLVLADLNNDGTLDLVKRVLDDGSQLHLSRCSDLGWIRVRLQAGGENTFGVGAKVRITVDGQSQIRWIHSGSSGMYSGAPLEAHFGVGAADSIDVLEVIWPDGDVSRFVDVAARQQVTVSRP